MSNSIVSFAFQDRNVRTAQKEDGSIWFCLTDSLSAMGTSTTTSQAQTLLSEGLGGGYTIVIPTLDALNRESKLITAIQDRDHIRSRIA